MILVIGASGNIGTEAVRLLAERGEQVRALSRDPARVTGLAAGVDVVRGDIDDPASLPPAFDGISKVLLIAAGHDVPAEEENVMAAASQAGVEHLVLLSSLGVETGVASGPIHAPGETLLRSSDMDWTILRPGFFMANAMMWRDTIVSQGTIYEPTGTGRHAVIHPADIGAVAAEVLTGSGHVGLTYELTGPEAISSADCASALSSAVGTTISHVDIPDEAFRGAMTNAGAPPAVVDSLARYYALVREGRFDMVTPAVADLLGRPARSFETWAVENASAFS